ncbi:MULTISPECIES: phosphatase PAP2 family protein [unclassified Streptomyces]|uniref:phosphatase PAP2 family protein n=1 Tax=unclassified Streptomyces TaxID=2593676 RepID=UPI0006F3D38D|nr:MULTISPECIES: phosphatase PAP2 family protein [unclassified Streptomyces]KQX46311.1 hypothetical protein ASD33_23635 [Streptomyces sp. Root1304]KRA81096.1 hypothetical protein ASE09_16735 [Streptomyces sp. Root66D1]
MTGRPAPPVLHPPLRAWLGPLAVLAALTVLALGVLYADGGAPGRVDARIGAAVDGVAPRWRDVALAVDFLGEPVGAATLIGITVTGCLLLRRPRAAVLLVAGVGLTVATTTLLKPLVGRTIHGEENLSFPSGHTAFLTAFALVVALLVAGRLRLGRTAGTSLVLAAGLIAGAAMGGAQVALGAHYPTDTLGGWCTALAVVTATAWLVDRAADRWAVPTDDGTADTGRRVRR